MLSSVAIILVEPENPDNIGATARAMKNMGLSDLRLVSPPRGWKIKGRKLAMSAVDLLESAKVFRNPQKAIEDLHFVAATSRRTGQHRGRFRSFNQSIEQIFKQAQTQKAGVFFGKESKGLDNDSLELCDWIMTIPSHDAYPSLNLAQAVMTVCFSLYQKMLKDTSKEVPPAHPSLLFATRKEQKSAFEHWEEALRALNYGGPREDLLERVLATSEGIFKRSGMLVAEAQMLKGLSRRIRQIAALRTVKK